MGRARHSWFASAAFVLAVVALSGCKSTKHRLQTPTNGKCPAPIVLGRGHFFQEGGMHKALFQLMGSYEGALSAEEKRRLISVDIYGSPGTPSLDVLTSFEHFKLDRIHPDGIWWAVDGLSTTNAQNAWVDGQPYTIGVVHHYRGGIGAGIHSPRCDRGMTLLFKVQESPIVKGSEVQLGPGHGSTGASVSVTGLFYGAQGYALYEGGVIYDTTVGSTKMAKKIELFSASVSDPAVLFSSGSLFKTRTNLPPLPPNQWTFSSIRDWNYDGSPTWFVGARVTYTDDTTSDSPTLTFTGLSTKQGVAVPGE